MLSAVLFRAAKDRRLRGEALRVLIELHDWCDWAGYRPVKLQALARTLGLPRGNVTRAVTKLKALGYVEEGPFDPTRGQKTFRLIVLRVESPEVITRATPHAA